MDAITREEKYLKAIATGDAGAGLPAPVTRKEQYLYAIATSGAGGGGGGTTDYNALTNKPKINGVTVEGNKSAEDFGIESGLSGEDAERFMEMRNRLDDLENRFNEIQDGNGREW